jgi:polyisoprenoid-binding protein YceI
MKLFCTFRFLVPALVVGLFAGSPARIWPQVTSKEEKAATRKTYEVDTRVSRFYVQVDPDGRGHVHGMEGRLASGSVTLGASKKAGKLVFDLTSLTADEPSARKYLELDGKMTDSDRRSITRTMLGSSVLDTRKYPRATCILTAVTPLERQAAGKPGRYRFEGRLDLHGTQRSLRFEARAEETKTSGTLQVRGKFSLRQTDYKIKPYSAFFGALKVKDELRIHGDLLLVPGKTK